MKKIHLICNAHIDPIWQWDWQEGVSAVLSTFRSAVNLADKYDYIFCHNEVTVYKYVEEYDPQLFEKISELIQAGNWHVTGGWYLQPDDHMPSGESFVRQIQMGFDYFREKFGVTPTTAFNVDAFGHTRGLVQIMKKCGQNAMICCRPHTDEKILDKNVFVWKGFDGSEVKVHRLPEAYNAPLGATADEIKARIEKREADEEITCVLWGVGNHGGGPSDKDLADITKMIEETDEYEIVHSTPDAYFSEINPSYTVEDSLYISMPGCYTSSICVKQKHIDLENELYLAELMSSVASAKGLMEYPKDELYACFEDLLNAEFHDVLPGSSIKAGEDNGLMLLNHGMLDATRLKTRAYFALCREQAKAQEGEFPILVFNPHPYELTDNIECEFMLADQNWSDTHASFITIKDGEHTIPYQVVKEESNITLDWRKRVIFEATLPPMSVKRFSLYVELKPEEKKELEEVYVFDDGRKYVEICKTTGLLKSYRIDGKEYIKDGFLPVMYADHPDPWAMGAEDLKRMGTNGRAFDFSENPSGVFGGMKSIQVIEDGDIYLGIEAFFEKDNSKARIEYRIYKNNDDVDVNVTLFFNDINKIVKLAVPVCNAENLIGQTAFGTDKLFEDGRENTSQRFDAVKSGGKYLAVLNKSLYGGHYENDTMYFSLVRGTTYCAHPIPNRPLMPLDRYTKKMDQAEHNYHFRVTVCDECELERKAMEFNRLPYAVNVFPTGSKVERKDFEVLLSNKNITLAALKKADKQDGYILRLVNNYSEGQTTELTVGDAKAVLSFGKYEVKTVLYNGMLKELATMEI